MKRLYNGISQNANNRNELNYISICNSDVKNPVTNDVYYLKVPLFKKNFNELYRLPLSVISSIFLAIKLVRKYEINLIISTGPLVGVIFSFILKLAQKKVIYIETWSRFYTKSSSGKLAYLFSDYFYIQNKSLKSIYPKGIYVSRL